MAKPRRITRWLTLLLVGGAVAVSTARAFAQDILRVSYHVPGDSKPVVLHADTISTWLEGSHRVILLKGKVLVEHGLVHSRMQQAVLWIDQEGFRRTGIMNLEIYGEGEVLLEKGPEVRKAPKTVLGLSTRGEVKLKSQEGKIRQDRQAGDALFQRAQAVRPNAAPTTPPAPAPVIRGQSPDAAPLPPGNGTPASVSLASPAGGTDVPPLPGVPVDPARPTPGTPTQGPGPPPSPGFNPPPAVTPPLQVPAPRLQPPAPPPPGPRGMLDGPPRQLSIAPRTASMYQMQSFALPNGEQAVVFTGGVILNVRTDDKNGLVDIEADRLVFWTRGNAQQLLGNFRTPQGTNSTRETEFYLAGNVEIRQVSGKDSRTLRADEVYYDVGRNVAVAMNGDLEFRQPNVPDPIHLKAQELLQLSPTQFQGVRAEVFSSRLPSDPGLKVYVAEATIEEKTVPKRTIFGQQFLSRQSGQPEEEKQSIFHGSNVFIKVEDVPIFYLPFIQGDARDPLGPLESVKFSQDRIFGTHLAATWNVYDLIGIDPLPGTRWRLDTDYLSQRGPALGTDFNYMGKDLLGVPGNHQGLIKAFGINDTGTDVLGGPRGPDQHHPESRGRFLWRNNSQELLQDFTVQWQISALSDKNFLEQYYKIEFDNDINQETFLYVKQQRDNWAWTVLTEPRIRNWVTETEWLPRGDGYLIGQSLFDLFTYNLHASAGYAQLQPTHLPPPPALPTDQRVDTGRLDVFQELSLPFSLGPVRVVPYGVLDLTYYTRDLTGDDRGRVYGGGGVRTSIPFSRLYPEVQSELWNLNGIHHKIVLSSNYFIADSDTSFRRFPQLDRLDDDATDQARRDIRPLQPGLNPAHGLFLATSPLFDPQRYAIRRLVDNRVDTLDDIEVLQLDLRQRWQTKRGFPGNQHIIDWMTLDLSASYFPNPTRDASGTPFALMEYDWLWNIGDRTALVSTGWIDPVDNGARVFTVGAYLNRPDRTNFFLGYRQIDPVNSQAMTGAVTYIFSPKYAMTASSTYDFGTKQSLANSLVLTRMGSDFQVSLGITYNAILNNFGFTFEILPNLIPPSQRVAAMRPFGSGVLGR